MQFQLVLNEIISPSKRLYNVKQADGEAGVLFLFVYIIQFQRSRVDKPANLQMSSWAVLGAAGRGEEREIGLGQRSAEWED